MVYYCLLRNYQNTFARKEKLGKSEDGQTVKARSIHEEIMFLQ